MLRFTPIMVVQLTALVILLFSVVLHEIAHGYVAYRLGDFTAKSSGRLTLNPLKHIDPLGSVMVPLLLYFSGSRFLFGWAKPVPVNQNNFANPKRDMMFCALAGPLTNFFLAFTASLILKNFTLQLFWKDVIATAIWLNLILGVFNLLPIPPLDGSRVLAYFLSGNAAYHFYRLEPYGPLIVLLLLYFGVLNIILKIFSPFFRWFF